MELTLDHISRRFGKTQVLRDVSLTFSQGIYGLLGPNGAGKTTLMRILADVLVPTQGKVFLNGQNKDQMGDAYRAGLGYLPQEVGVYANFTARAFLQYIAALKGLPKDLTQTRIEHLAAQVGLEDEMGKKCGKLSGGMKRRLGIAQALLNNPALLIFDEPTAGLDPMERLRFLNLIQEIGSERIILLSTHIVPDVDRVAKEIVMIGKGEVLCQGTVEQLTRDLQSKDNETPTLEDVYVHYFERGQMQ